jgi:hypothetical protein
MSTIWNAAGYNSDNKNNPYQTCVNTHHPTISRHHFQLILQANKHVQHETLSPATT